MQNVFFYSTLLRLVVVVNIPISLYGHYPYTGTNGRTRSCIYLVEARMSSKSLAYSIDLSVPILNASYLANGGPCEVAAYRETIRCSTISTPSSEIMPGSIAISSEPSMLTVS